MANKNKARYTRTASSGAHSWPLITDRINAFERERREALARLPVSDVVNGFLANPVGAFLANPWVTWARWQDLTSASKQIDLLLAVANGKPVEAPAISGSASGSQKAVLVKLPADIDRNLWRDRLRKIAEAQNEEQRLQLARSMTPHLIREIADNTVFGVDKSSFTALRFRMLEQPGSTSTLSYATLLLLDPDGAGRTLCECKFEGCGVFFFPKEESPRKRLYCDDHRQLAQDRKNRDRVRQHRQRKKKPRIPK